MKQYIFRLFPWLSFFLLMVTIATAANLQRIAVLSAFDPELAAIRAEMIPVGKAVKTSTINGVRFDEIDIEGRHFVFALSGCSMVNAAMTTQLVIDRFHVDAVVFSGIAGGVNPKLHPGDVIIPAEWIHQMESVWANPDPQHAGQYILSPSFVPKYGNYHDIFPDDVSAVREGTKKQKMHGFPADPNLLNTASLAVAGLKLEGSKGGTAKVVLGGSGMSGPVFLDNAEFRRFAYDTWHVDGHDMESTAVAQVGWCNHIPILIVRGLSDLAGGQTGTNEIHDFLHLAAKNAAIVTARILLRLPKGN